MSLLRSLERLKLIDEHISRRKSGPSIEFAEKLGISRSMLMENLREMRELGATIYYCPYSRSYCYEREFRLIIGAQSKADSIYRGGNLGFNFGLEDFDLFDRAFNLN